MRDHDFYGFFYVLIVYEWFTHTHKNDISDCSERLVIFFTEFRLDEIVREEKLGNDLILSQISLDSEFASDAENTIDGAADL